MTERMAELAARKELLLARSRLHRIEVQHEAIALRRSLFKAKTAFSIAASPTVRPLIFSALMFVVGRGRMSRLLRRAMGIVAAVKTVTAVAAWVNQSGVLRPRAPAPAPTVSGSRMPPHPDPRDPEHREWVVDEAAEESFPASDPSAIAQPHGRS